MTEKESPHLAYLLAKTESHAAAAYAEYLLEQMMEAESPSPSFDYRNALIQHTADAALRRCDRLQQVLYRQQEYFAID